MGSVSMQASSVSEGVVVGVVVVTCKGLLTYREGNLARQSPNF